MIGFFATFEQTVDALESAIVAFAVVAITSDQTGDTFATVSERGDGVVSFGGSNGVEMVVGFGIVQAI